MIGRRRLRIIAMIGVGVGVSSWLAAPFLLALGPLISSFDWSDPLPGARRVVGTVAEQPGSAGLGGAPVVFGDVTVGIWSGRGGDARKLGERVLPTISTAVRVDTDQGPLTFALPPPADVLRHGCRNRLVDPPGLSTAALEGLPRTPTSRVEVAVYGLRVGDPVILALNEAGEVERVACLTPEALDLRVAQALAVRDGLIGASAPFAVVLAIAGAVSVLIGLVAGALWFAS